MGPSLTHWGQTARGSEGRRAKPPQICMYIYTYMYAGSPAPNQCMYIYIYNIYMGPSLSHWGQTARSSEGRRTKPPQICMYIYIYIYICMLDLQPPPIYVCTIYIYIHGPVIEPLGANRSRQRGPPHQTTTGPHSAMQTYSRGILWAPRTRGTRSHFSPTPARSVAPSAQRNDPKARPHPKSHTTQSKNNNPQGPAYRFVSN